MASYPFFLLGIHPLEETLLYPQESLTVRLVLVVLGKGHRDALRNALFDGGKHTTLVSWEGLKVGLQFRSASLPQTVLVAGEEIEIKASPSPEVGVGMGCSRCQGGWVRDMARGSDPYRIKLWDMVRRPCF